MADTKRKRGVSRRKKNPATKPASKQAQADNAEDVKVEIIPSSSSSITYDTFSAKRQTAKILFISGAASLPQISRELEIPEGTLRSWHTRDRWKSLRMQVQQYASKDSVKRARKAMGRYAYNIDKSINTLLNNLSNKFKQGEFENAIKNETDAYRLLFEGLRLKLTLLRTMAQVGKGDSFSPHPTTSIFEGTDDGEGGLVSQSDTVSKMLDSIPGYMREATNFVLAIDSKDISSHDIVEAVSNKVDNELDLEEEGFFDNEIEEADFLE